MGTRRAILTTGGAAIVVAGTSWALTRAPKAARAPWEVAAKGFGDPRLDALSYAILAPSPHNMQPWKAMLHGDDAFYLYADLKRLLPETDPKSRQVTVGLGAFLELFRQAAAEKGCRVKFDYFPDGESLESLDERPVAFVRILGDSKAERDPLFGEAISRRTNRNAFDSTAVEVTKLQNLISATVADVDAQFTTQSSMTATLRTIAKESWRAEWALARTRRETIGVTRIGKMEINNHPWGITLSGPFMESLSAIGLLTRSKMDEVGSTAHEETYAVYANAIDSAGAFVWSTTLNNTRRDQLEAGRAWVRMHLAASQNGLAFHPLSQSLQEFPEVAEHYQSIHALLAPEGSVVQMLARVGYATGVPPAPRESLSSKIMAG